MSRRVALLRGINVGRAARIAMSDLAACTEAAGCTDVSTVLATGNVVFTDPRPLDELRGVLEAAYSERFDYTAVVQVLDLCAVAAAVESYPFETLDQHHDYVVFSDDPAVTARVLDEMTAALDGSPTGAVAAGPDCLHWRMAKGETLSSAAGKVLDGRESKRHLTTRNIRTLRKLLAADADR
ncbi:MAG TPA: DUF1697 domain-containing protein [Candidatus Dietzia intestinipullorum]|nr:DUF1697 domain-containing protein [Candidatus Dietzia intestinipullorum]